MNGSYILEAYRLAVKESCILCSKSEKYLVVTWIVFVDLAEKNQLHDDFEILVLFP